MIAPGWISITTYVHGLGTALEALSARMHVPVKDQSIEPAWHHRHFRSAFDDKSHELNAAHS
jgi:hypothetical protein